MVRVGLLLLRQLIVTLRHVACVDLSSSPSAAFCALSEYMLVFLSAIAFLASYSSWSRSASCALSFSTSLCRSLLL